MKVSSFDFFDTVLILSPAQVFEGCCTNQLSLDAVGVLGGVTNEAGTSGGTDCRVFYVMDILDDSG